MVDCLHCMVYEFRSKVLNSTDSIQSFFLYDYLFHVDRIHFAKTMQKRTVDMVVTSFLVNLPAILYAKTLIYHTFIKGEIPAILHFQTNLRNPLLKTLYVGINQ